MEQHVRRMSIVVESSIARLACSSANVVSRPPRPPKEDLDVRNKTSVHLQTREYLLETYPQAKQTECPF